MKKEIILTLLFILAIGQFVSAEIIINKQPNEIYNLGDSVTIPVTAKTITGISGTFNMNLLCGSKEINFYKNGINLKSGEEERIEASLVLTKEIVGQSTGICKIKGTLGTEYFLTNEFKISNSLIIIPNSENSEFEPGQRITLSGNIIRENKEPADGFVEIELILSNKSSENILQKGTMKNGMYSVEITLPEKIKAGKYNLNINAYEVGFDNTKTNKGSNNYEILLKQIPTSLEIILKNINVKSGKNAEIKIILHDQTGENINSIVPVLIEKENLGIEEENFSERLKIRTGEFFKFPIEHDEPPSNWSVWAESNGLEAKSYFNIIETKEIKAELKNQTLIITNIGNIPYNGQINIRLEGFSKDFNLSLPINGENKYKLNAEYEGEHEVELQDENKESIFKGKVFLSKSGVSSISAASIVDLSESSLKKFYKVPIFWIFILVIVIAVIIISTKKYKKRKRMGITKFKKSPMNLNMHSSPKTNIEWESRTIPLSKESKLKTNNKANLSLSIKGNKQEVSMVTLSIRNLAELQENKSNTEEPLQKVINLAELKKAFVYENQNNLTFILVPSKTRTLKNETTALEIAQDAKEIISNYNRIAKYKMDFGISIDFGSIIEKTERNVMQFTGLGTLMNNSRKIAALSKGEVLIGENIKNKLTNVRLEKLSTETISCYKIKDIKYYDAGHSRYMENFINKKTSENKNIEDKEDTEKSTDPKSLIKGFY